MKLIKNFILWFILLIITLLYIPGIAYIYWSILNYFFFSSIGGESAFSNTFSWIWTTNFFLVLGVFFISVIVYCIASFILINLVALRKDMWCKVGNYYDDLKGQPHKTRKSGKEWKAEYKKRKAEKKKEYERENAEKRRREQAEEEAEFNRFYNKWHKNKQSNNEQQYYQQNNQQYYQQNNYQQYYQQNNSRQAEQTSELEEARIAFMLKSMDFTEEELKHNRNVLIKAWHTDNGEENAENAQKINRYYSLLKQYAKK